MPPNENAIERFPSSSKMDYQGIKPGIVPASVDDVLTIAKVFAASGLYPDARAASVAAVKIMAGAEFGCTPVASMNAFHVIEGKIAMHYVLVGARIKESGKYRVRVLEKSRERARIEFFEKEDGDWLSVGIEEFTIQDAINLKGKEQVDKVNGNWFKSRATMLFARALTSGARSYCPEVFGGQPVYTEDELREEAPERDPNLTDRGDQVMAMLQPKPEAVAPDAVVVADESVDGLQWLSDDLGMSVRELADFTAWCASRSADPSVEASRAKSEGVTTVKALYEFLEGAAAQERLL